MNTLCVVASGKKKIWDARPSCGPQKACDIYTGPFTRKCLDYAATFHPSSWCVLSPKYGFLIPDYVVYAPGCAKFDRRETLPLSIKTLALQARTLKLDQYATVVALAGQAYLAILREVFPQARIESPLLGRGGIGTMMSALTAAVKTKAQLA
ncbi:MAG: DUF6884 domain-containing protein [Halobacteriota archaeon]